MLQTNRNRKVCQKVAVNLDVGDGEAFAYMFIPPAQRVSDVLNDQREFLPFERADGSIIMIAKRCIRQLVPMESGPHVDAKDPYDLLGVAPSATDAEVQEAYHRAVGPVHPDRMHALGLPSEFMELATRRTAKLNDAYRKIKALRRSETELAGSSAA